MMESNPQYYSYADGSAYPCFSTEKERRYVENFRNVERQAAYELRQSGYEQPIIFKVK